MDKIKNLMVLGMFALGCGATADGEYAMPKDGAVDALGQLEQTIFVPAGYGHYAGGGQCSSAVGCFVPDKKYIQAKFYASTCSSWWQARMVTAFAGVEAFLDNLGDDWGMIGPGSGLYEVRCGATGGALGNFAEDDLQPHSSGLIQYNQGDILIDSAAIQADPGWAAATESSRQKFSVNAIYHEFGHLLGLPHEAGTIMSANASANWWTTHLFYSAAQVQRMRCYNEDSGTDDDC